MDPDQSVEEISENDSENNFLSYEEGQWRKLTEAEEKKIDNDLGLVKIELRVKKETFQSLEESAKEKGIIVQALIRKILEDSLFGRNS